IIQRIIGIAHLSGPMRQGGCQLRPRRTEVSNSLGSGGHISLHRNPAILKTPLLRPEEEKLVLLYRTAKVTTEVVIFQLTFRRLRSAVGVVSITVKEERARI